MKTKGTTIADDFRSLRTKAKSEFDRQTTHHTRLEAQFHSVKEELAKSEKEVRRLAATLASIDRTLNDASETTPNKRGPKAATPKVVKTAGNKQGKQTKSGFIRSFPNLSAQEIVEKAKAKGITLDANHVYSVRATDRKTGKAPTVEPKATKAAPKATKAPKAATKPGKTAEQPTMTKSDFVRSLPESTSAKDVVTQAKAAGIKLTAPYVYSVRAADRKTGKAPKAAKTAAPKAAKTAAPKAEPKAAKAAAEPKAARGRKDGPTLKEAVKTVMGDQIMKAEQVLAGMKARGWVPNAKDPDVYIGHFLSSMSNPNVTGGPIFERVADKRGHYRVIGAKATTSTEKHGSKRAKNGSVPQTADDLLAAAGLSITTSESTAS